MTINFNIPSNMTVIRLNNGANEDVVIDLNARIKIVKIDENTTFRVNKIITGSTKGNALFIDGLGFIAFEKESLPYIYGGKLSELKKLVKDGFFCSYDGMKFLIPITK